MIKQYRFKTNSTDEFDKYLSQNQRMQNDPYIKEIDDGLVLPSKSINGGPAWGLGGVIDKNGHFVEESRVETGFGGIYEYDEDQIETTDETVIFVPCVIGHYGHFLINTLCRFWDADLFNSSIKVSFCIWGFEKDVTGAADLILNILGVPKERRIIIRKPTRFSKILIPSESFGYAARYSPFFKNIFKRIVEKVNSFEEFKSRETFDKIYFTRRKLLKHRFNEFGEKQIEKCFMKNGFKVLAPEDLTIYEQIYYFSHCKVMASITGTTTHNAVFMKQGSEIIVLNRTPEINPPQIKLAKLFDIDSTFIDCFRKRDLKAPPSYGVGPFFVCVNENLRSYFKDEGYIIPYNAFMVAISYFFNSIIFGFSKIAIKLYRKIKYHE